MKNLRTICARASQLIIDIENLKQAYKLLDEYESVLVKHPKEIQKYGLTFIDTFEGKNVRWKATSFKRYQLAHIATERQQGPFKLKKSRKKK